jgi:hypothetical protein
MRVSFVSPPTTPPDTTLSDSWTPGALAIYEGAERLYTVRCNLGILRAPPHRYLCAAPGSRIPNATNPHTVFRKERLTQFIIASRHASTRRQRTTIGASACATANRTLTQSEWSQLIPNTPYQAAC